MQARLIYNAMCELGQAGPCISNLFGTFDIFGVCGVWFPERVLFQMIGFFNHHFAAVEGFHDLNRTARNAIGAPEQ